MIINDYVSNLAINFTEASQQGVAAIMSYLNDLTLRDILTLIEYEGQTRDFSENAVALLTKKFKELSKTPQAKRLAQENGFSSPKQMHDVLLGMKADPRSKNGRDTEGR